MNKQKKTKYLLRHVNNSMPELNHEILFLLHQMQYATSE